MRRFLLFILLASAIDLTYFNKIDSNIFHCLAAMTEDRILDKFNRIFRVLLGKSLNFTFGERTRCSQNHHNVSGVAYFPMRIVRFSTLKQNNNIYFSLEQFALIFDLQNRAFRYQQDLAQFLMCQLNLELIPESDAKHIDEVIA